MSSKIDILTSGYAILHTNQDGGKFMKATGSCCLVRSTNIVTLFDTMGPWEKDLLVSKLAELKIHVDDINYLVCSHSHPDHVGNLNLFTKAKKHFIGTSVYTDDVYDLNCFEPVADRTITVEMQNGNQRETQYIEYEPYKLNENLHIHPTPGHTMECISMVVKNCEYFGTIGLAGDLFESWEDLKDEGIWLRAGSQNPDLQRAHRKRLLEQVDYILPGHGSVFKTRD